MAIYNNLPIIGRFLKSNSRINQYSPAQQKEHYQAYRDHIGLGKDITLGGDAFDKLVAVRRQDIHGFFKDTKIDSELLIKKKLKKNDIVQNAIVAALKPSDDFTEAQAKYKKSSDGLKKLLDDVPRLYKAQDLIATMTEIKNEAREAIKTQHALEKEQLTSRLADSDTTSALANAMGFTERSDDVTKLKETLIKDLESGHKKQLAYFDKSTQTAVTQLHESASTEAKRIIFLANLRKNNPEMRKRIEEEMEKNRLLNNPGNTQAVFGVDLDGEHLSGVTLEAIGTIKSVSRLDMVRSVRNDKDGKEIVSYTVSTPRHVNLLTAPLYYLDPRQNVKADLTTMAQAIRASGHDRIKMTLEFPDHPKIAEQRAREAYEACISAGFDPDKIVIMSNGVRYSSNEKNDKGVASDTIGSQLFKDHRRTYKTLQQQAKDIAKTLKGMDDQVKKDMDKPTPQGVAAVKQKLGELIAASNQAAAASQVASSATANSAPANPNNNSNNGNNNSNNGP